MDKHVLSIHFSFGVDPRVWTWRPASCGDVSRDGIADPLRAGRLFRLSLWPDGIQARSSAGTVP